MPIHLKPNDSRKVPWKNGRGMTLEIASDAKHHDGPWTWRLSMADVPDSGAFSRFEGCERFIACVDGGGMRLATRGQILAVPLEGEALRFSGDDDTIGELLGSPCRDLNLMVSRDAWMAQLWLARGAFDRRDEKGATLIVHVIDGAAGVDEVHGAGYDLASGETLIVRDAATITRAMGVVALARLVKRG